MTQWNEIYKKDPKSYKYYDLDKPHADIPRIAKLFKGKKVKRVLDLGCGSGRNLIYLANNGFEVYGIDNAPNGIKSIRKKIGKRARLKVGNAFSALPYADGFFDAVISVQVLQHSGLRGIRLAISEIYRVLRPGGLLFVTLAGRYSKGKLRYCLVKTAKKVSENTFVPTTGDERGLVHFIYNKKLLLRHYSDFDILDVWKDERDYYCLLGKKPTG